MFLRIVSKFFLLKKGSKPISEMFQESQSCILNHCFLVCPGALVYFAIVNNRSIDMPRAPLWEAFLFLEPGDRELYLEMYSVSTQEPHAQSPDSQSSLL